MLTFKKLFLILVFSVFSQTLFFDAALAEEAAKSDSSADASASANKASTDATAKQNAAIDKITQKDAQQEAAEKERAEDLSNWGTANLEAVRNMTTSYTDIFFQEDQNGLAAQLPNNTIIQIATLRNDLPKMPATIVKTEVIKTDAEVETEIVASNYWDRLDRDVQLNLQKILTKLKTDAVLATFKKPDEVVDAVETWSRLPDFATTFNGSYQGSVVDFAQTLKNQIRALFAARMKSEEETSIYRLFAVRNLMGAWRLVADTQDKSDPATQFIVENYRDSQLNNWLGLRPVVQDKLYVEALGGNVITVSAEKFAVDSAKSAHWRIDGSSLANCAFLSRSNKGFLSCRDLKDEKKLEVFGYNPKTQQDYDFTLYTTERPPKQWTPHHRKTEIVKPYDVIYSHQTALSQDLFSKIEDLANYFYVYRDMQHQTYHVDNVTVSKNLTHDQYRYFDETIRDPKTKPYSLSHMLFLADKVRQIMAKKSSAGGATLPERFAKQIKENVTGINDQDLQQALQKIIAQAPKDSPNHKSGSKFNRVVNYGDQLKIVSLKNLKHLYAKAQALPKFAFLEDHNQGFLLSVADYEGAALPNELSSPDGWWVIKGGHAGTDSFNATVGKPVKNGDKIRLEHVPSAKNLHGTDIQLYNAIEPGRQPDENFKDNNGVTLFGKTGVGDTSDNWVVSLKDDDSKELSFGLAFELKHETTGYRLSINETRKVGDVASDAIATLQEYSSADTAFAISAIKAAALPVENVAWTGIPYLAASTDRGPKEDLQINIIKKGMGGGIAPNNTLEVKVNIKDKQPMVTGFAKEDIPEFSPGLMANLSALFDQGVAWITQSFEKEGMASASFLVRAGDAGNAQVLFGNNMTLDFSYKFVLGANENTETQLLRRDFDSTGRAFDTVVASISKEQNPLAALRSGVFAPYWVSVVNGTIMLGFGEEVGENLLLVWNDSNPRTKVSRLGFSCDRQSIDVTNVKIGKPFKLTAPKVVYAKAKSEESISQTKKKVSTFADFQAPPVPAPTTLPVITIENPFRKPTPALSPTPTTVTNVTNSAYPAGVKLRVPGRGGLVFDVKGSQQLDVILSSRGTEQKPDGQVRYILKFFGEKDAADMPRRVKFYLDNVATLVKLLEQQFTANNTDAKNAIAAAKRELKNTFANLPAESITLMDNSFKEFMRNFEKWSELKDAFDTFKNKLIEMKWLITKDATIDLSALQSGVSFTADPAAGDQTVALFDAMITKLRADFNIPINSSRDPLNSPPPKTPQEAILGLFASIFANRFFDLEAKPICALQRIDSKTGINQTVRTVLEIDQNSKESVVKIPKNSYRRYWVNFTQSRIFIGSGEYGDNLFLYFWDKEPLDDFEQIAFSSVGEGKLRDFAVTAELPVARQDSQDAYEQDYQLFDFKGKLQVILPYKYRLSQEGPSVKFKDELTGKTYYPGKVPQKGAMYYFMLVIRENGFPELTWKREPENAQKLELDKSAFITRATSDTLYQASTYVQGMGAIGGLVGVAASLIYSGAGVGQGIEAGKKEAASQFNYKAHDSYVYTDQAKTDKLVSAEIPPDAITNKVEFEKDLNLIGNWIGDASKLALLLPKFKQVLSRITHPFVVSNQSNKQLFFSHLSSIINTHKNVYADPKTPVDATFSDLIKLLMAAYNNRYLIDQNNKGEQKIRNDWYAKTNDLARSVLQKDPGSALTLDPMYGEYVWLNDVFSTLGNGSISFQAIGQNDFMVAFASEPTQVRNSAKQIYEVSIGSWDNTKTVIRTTSLGKTVAENSHVDLRCKIVKSVNAKDAKYWISVNNGKIVLGKGDLDPSGAIGVFNEAAGQFVPAVWSPATLKKTAIAAKLIVAEEKILKYINLDQLLLDVATMYGAQSFEVSAYTALMTKLKTSLAADKFTRTLLEVNKPLDLPTEPEKLVEFYQNHLGAIVVALKSESEAFVVSSYAGDMETVKTAIDWSHLKDLASLLKTIPQPNTPAATVLAHMRSLTSTFQEQLPDILDKNPLFEYDQVGSFTTEPFSWQDPYPIRDIKYVGLSSWDAPIEYSNITIGPRVEEVDLFKANLVAKIRAMQGESIAEIAK